MDRDVALKVLEALEAIQVACETIATNTTPAETPSDDPPAEETGT